MIPLANRYTVVFDACVLFPNLKRDLLLRFFTADLFRARWSEKIQQEWLQNAMAKYPENRSALERTDQLMRRKFESAWVEDFEKYLDIVSLPDPDDRHVVASAIQCKAQYIVTDNVKDFPVDELAKYELECGTADRFLAGTFEHYVWQALDVIREHRAGLKSKPTTTAYIMDLTAKGLPLLAARLKPHQNAI